MAVGEHDSGEAGRYRARPSSIMPWEAYGWAGSMLKRRWKLTAFFALAAFYYGPMNLYQVAVLPGMEPPANIVVQYAALWAPVALVVQALAYRYAAVEYGTVEASRSNLWIALRRVPNVVALSLLFGTGYVILAVVVALLATLIASILGAFFAIVLGLLAAVAVAYLALPTVVRAVNTMVLSFPAAVIDGGIVDAMDGGLAAGRVSPLSVTGLLFVGAVPLVVFQVAVSEANATMVVLGVASGLWLTATQIALARTYLQYRVPPS